MMETARDDRRVALITGCGLRTGVGATTARTLARSGVSVMVADISTAGAGGADEVEPLGLAPHCSSHRAARWHPH